jgi:hypothetical protein
MWREIARHRLQPQRSEHALASKRLVDFEKIDLVQTGGV